MGLKQENQIIQTGNHRIKKGLQDLARGPRVPEWGPTVQKGTLDPNGEHRTKPQCTL